ncbi:MAG: acetate--CoA ligase family protein [Burkholderiales bacterium]|nr:acetate--CoA ligase family protein [Burkholderiales bacterium]
MNDNDLFDHASIAPFFMAESLAVIGASSDPHKYGGRPARWARLGGFRGRVYPINPGAAQVQGMRAYPSLAAVEGTVDCAFIAVPAAAVEDAVRACAAKGVRAAIVITAGFGELGEEGRARQERIAAIARAAGMRMLGPNCMGVINFARRFYPTFLTLFRGDEDPAPASGSISLVSQSGAVGGHVYELGRARGVGFAKWITTGNQADVQVADCIAWFAQDPQTRAIMVYMEGSPDPGRLLRALRLARQAGKPVVLLKSGRSQIGGEAARSHTGALTGSDAAFDGLCAQTGVHRARTIDELVDVALATTHGRYPARAEVGMVTVSGGVGALMADYAEELGLAVPALPASAQRRLLEVFPHGSARNPVDPTALWAQDVSVFGHSLRALLDEGGHDAVVIFLSVAGTIPVLRDRILEQIVPVCEEFPGRLVVISMMGSAEVLAAWREKGFLMYEEPRRALEVVAALARFGARVVRAKALPPAPRVPGSLRVLPRGRLGEHEAMDLLERAGIPFAPRRLAVSRLAAERAAAGMGFPVVLKLASPDIAHKSDIGGVILGLTDRRAVGNAHDLVLRRARKAAPGAQLQGVLVAHQIQGGVETIIGASCDPALGPVVMFGIGGVFVEIYRDVAFRVAPISPREAREMIGDIRGYALLAGARGRAPADIQALARALSRLSVFAAANADTVRGIDINPFIVLERGRGACGVDALVEFVEK